MVSGICVLSRNPVNYVKGFNTKFIWLFKLVRRLLVPIVLPNILLFCLIPFIMLVTLFSTPMPFPAA